MELHELIASGREKLASVSSSGGVAMAVAVRGGGGGAAPSAPAKVKKEEKVKEKEELDDNWWHFPAWFLLLFGMRNLKCNECTPDIRRQGKR
ncbi:hypothetical protein E5676_scaffold76G00310 [Cucumis melo var. makuwa]|uniref:Uncharacterized protein n=1 Tax=Cucumis melo var. makuwa TaxID=1194695 RepID=A0A5A7VI88_CUCMM|nr:hypothetical protein E6C27_scaffold17G001880 [Cucumis melo var. makuwa]TYK08725.1 hypothetical protein E5676_scaffold76G00310 [Cucumis melo var. makuwa]